jgi:hypothetical protein
MLLLSNNYLFNTNFPIPRINQKNFAVNGRCYDASNTNMLLSNSLYNPGATQTPISLGAFNKTTVNTDTAMGQAWFHENRYIGKGFFSYTF